MSLDSIWGGNCRVLRQADQEPPWIRYAASRAAALAMCTADLGISLAL